MRKLIRIVIFTVLVLGLTQAQDATKAEPKHYRLAFENDKVQVVYIQYGPHEKSKLHSHPQGVVVNITQAHLRFTDENGKVQDVFSKPGEARWFPPFRHTVENLGEESYSGVYIGVKGGAPSRGSAGQRGPQQDEQMAKILAAYLFDAQSVQGITGARGDEVLRK